MEMLLCRATDNFLAYISDLLSEILVARPEILRSWANDSVRLGEILDFPTRAELLAARAATESWRQSSAASSWATWTRTPAFTDTVGDPLWGRHVTTRQLEPLLPRAELPRIRFHDLRHTFATLQLAAGTNPKIVSHGRVADTHLGIPMGQMIGNPQTRRPAHLDRSEAPR
jgi:integrase